MAVNVDDEKKLIVRVNNLVKRYKGSKERAVDKVSFYVEEGSFFSLLGPNGAGKTTIVSILTTLLSKDKGLAEVAGFDVETEAGKVRRHIGVIFQNPSLDVNLTAEENIRFHANLYGLYPYRPGFGLMDPDYRLKVKQLAEVLGLEKDLFKPVKALSGGMKRKLEIIRSLMHRPKILFLDEPTTGLDPISRRNLWTYLQTIRKQLNTTVFLTTHYLEEAENADYVAIINQGQLVARGTPEEIKNRLIERYVVMKAQDESGLVKELKKHHLEYRFNQKRQVEVMVNGKSAQEIIQSIKTPLKTLLIHNPSLEEAYIDIIESKQDE